MKIKSGKLTLLMEWTDTNGLETKSGVAVRFDQELFDNIDQMEAHTKAGYHALIRHMNVVLDNRNRAEEKQNG